MTDNLTGLVWLRNANCFGSETWAGALADATTLASGACGLSDDSVPGDWRLPTRFELASLLDLQYRDPALSNAAGSANWTEGEPFFGVISKYWSSTSVAMDPSRAWAIGSNHGEVTSGRKIFGTSFWVWPVRGVCSAARTVQSTALLQLQQVVFYDGFETGDTSGWWAPARIGQTGQTACFNVEGTVIACAGTGQDGDLRGGVAWPIPRFTDSGNGTVADNLTGLMWLANANCFGISTWANALADAATLASGSCGLTDGSVAGQWRLPSRFELESLLDLEHYLPPLSDAVGTAKWNEGDPFSAVQVYYYWTLTTRSGVFQYAWAVEFAGGYTGSDFKASTFFVWPVRDP